MSCKNIQDAVLRCRDRQCFSKARLYEMVDLIRFSLGITPESYPLDPFSLQRRYATEVHLEFHTFCSDKIGGLLVKNHWPEMSCIVINAAKTPLSQRFDCAHELMHFFLHPPGRNYVCETLNAQAHPYEYQANEGAAELLLPYRQFIPDLLSFGQSAIPLNQALMRLAEAYQVSLMVIQYRISSLSFEISQYMNGKNLHELRILSRTKQKQYGLQSKNLQALLNQLVKPMDKLPKPEKLRFDCVEYEEELSKCGFYEPYYRGY